MLMKIADMAELAYSITEGNKYFSITSYLFIYNIYEAVFKFNIYFLHHLLFHVWVMQIIKLFLSSRIFLSMSLSITNLLI